MKRIRQTIEEIVEALSPIQTSWQDDHSRSVIQILNSIPQKPVYTKNDVGDILDSNFDAGLTAIRLILDLSKDEFQVTLEAELGSGGIGINRFRQHRDEFLESLVNLGFLTALCELANTPLTWRDLIIERLKGGRGSAIKGQRRGRYLEDFTERIVREIFGEHGFDVRCRFVGSRGSSTEKTDFAIPSKEDPAILIEVKAYGATGSKQTDVLGDVLRIVEEKRHDTHFLLITDGITWKIRMNDLRKLVDMQNTGLITRIYTHKMENVLRDDLIQLRHEFGFDKK